MLAFAERDRPYRGLFAILGYSEKDERFMAGLYSGAEWVPYGLFGKGMKQEERQSLVQTIMTNRDAGHAPLKGSAAGSLIGIKPAICVELTFDAISGNDQLVNPVFRAFRLREKAPECTRNRLIVDNADVPPEAGITHPDKPLWPSAGIDKEAYAAYLIQIAPRLLPFLRDRMLTSIRFPDGVEGERFYQKNCPKYAPDFIRTAESEGIDYILCNDLSTLVWLGNQAAIELHVPFQTFGATDPLEIVLDLDPPGREAFPLAIKAAVEIRAILESFFIVGYPKVSGGKGLQIHIPLGSAEPPLTYDDTRIFTSFVADYLVQKFPALFTTERLKKNRGNRLYVDYIQHAYGKTIISPYSARGITEATVAAPLYWEEVDERLTPEQHTIRTVLKRLEERPCPMSGYFAQANPNLRAVIEQLKSQVGRS
ncbi:non-homologous end-joining DNA ligase [Paenibacillus sp. LHD-117]|uniref:non-homologous end-joining DNA ligase n=1 Tax=Paenibacillus sp. LHD-117 TaxID=3071412 RepID=UPI0027DFE0BA|nr:non-homologous end-joining DNA ligase [Paenibacillus sp. LHD-117]MDQ6422445.1 non-homologous end-joining DNA ligase [Paenibacillus sp. LHD-117]